jgi:hypothetical protein
MAQLLGRYLSNPFDLARLQQTNVLVLHFLVTRRRVMHDQRRARRHVLQLVRRSLAGPREVQTVANARDAKSNQAAHRDVLAEITLYINMSVDEFQNRTFYSMLKEV